ncbi:hypothetical protein BCR44DRAFT_1281226 [Catenaria anguillulae PL171]|uniref:Uncharacterized protein n=1 Tax=Catenaria anguillulae PL171 TaxID=765915 RepID=A0A1Y2HYD7_9FUNG|nr:hypothetical protein BCR44DRAFT_1281226 [Catenaria anguillulae PL171]
MLLALRALPHQFCFRPSRLWALFSFSPLVCVINSLFHAMIHPFDFVFTMHRLLLYWNCRCCARSERFGERLAARTRACAGGATTEVAGVAGRVVGVA